MNTFQPRKSLIIPRKKTKDELLYLVIIHEIFKHWKRSKNYKCWSINIKAPVRHVNYLAGCHYEYRAPWWHAVNQLLG